MCNKFYPIEKERRRRREERRKRRETQEEMRGEMRVHLYLCSVRQKSLHRPLMAGSGSSARETDTRHPVKQAFPSCTETNSLRHWSNTRAPPPGQVSSSHLSRWCNASAPRGRPSAPLHWTWSLSQQTSSECLKPGPAWRQNTFMRQLLAQAW